MYKASHVLKDGSLVKTRQGQFGLVITHDWRRDHHYLERDLWLLVLIDNRSEWVRQEDLERWVEE